MIVPIERSALSECGRLDGFRVLAYAVALALCTAIVASFFMPWTQSAGGDGRVVAYAPSDRETPIRAPVDGRIVSWLVNEGDSVVAGQPLAELGDNDPNILDRLSSVRDAAHGYRSALESSIAIAEEQVRALAEARDAAVASAEAEVKMARDRRDEKEQKVLAARASEATAAINLGRQRDLNSKGLSSDRQFELAELAATTARSETAQAQASLRAAEREVQSAMAKLAETREKNRASIEKARAELEKLRADANAATAKTAEAETKLSRQQQMTIVAPRAGRILSVVARQGTDFVKTGDTLAVLVPEASDRAVELWVDGNDAPLIATDRRVRLQFEGWPAVQFVGWPSVAVGTFGGKVAFVDSASRADGKFRVMVVPDTDGETWPDQRFLRQGVRARGWVLLGRVSVAYELWRQFNGFPVALPGPGVSAANAEEKAK